jgi:HEPN domain-containing protein
LRIEDDYKKTEPVSDSEAAEALEMAEQFVREVREYLGKQGFLQRP